MNTLYSNTKPVENQGIRAILTELEPELLMMPEREFQALRQFFSMSPEQRKRITERIIALDLL